MKIYFDQQIFTQQKYGGISRYIFELSRNLIHLNNNVKILAPLHINKYIEHEKYIVGRYIEEYPKFTKKFFRYSNHLISKLHFTNLKNRPNILHETYYSNYSLAPNHTKKIITVHDMIHEIFPQNFSINDKTTQVKRRAIERADHVICISECTKQDLIRILDVPESKISVIYHGISELIGDEQIQFTYPFFLYVGQRGGYKNFEVLLRAYARSQFLKNSFKIIAFGGGSFTNEEYKMMTSLSINPNSILQITGDDGTLKSLYQQATTFIYPSLYEGFGLPPLEAMAHGCPTIAANASCIPEITGNAALLFDPHSVDDLIEKIEVSISSDTRTQLIEKGLTHHQKFTWEKCARETLAMYQSVLR